ncbi:magnesium transporter [Cyclobacterium marinum]|uniref:Magnesium transporter MgtE n=1 Tax=Cyclobacterium marinum (strain ATCC 25205 / DSM 745 / LMG 13164 / NCIMB 1802) TaxID=880070 RepID=G0IVM9_CYCMS|nr:magnesium transporter [Cyclobacterium marinum]AEL24796.1 magnesium transporter [Cyclobacterium marinum DSM 745]MBI0401730.1 magnesium transporter [Cyclobacterium marinum]
MEELNSFELSKEYLEALRENIESENVAFIQESMLDINKADVAAILDELDMMEALFVLRALDPDFSADILNELDEDPQYKVIKAMPPEELATLIDHMDSDDAVDILNQLVVNDREAVISHLAVKEKSLYIIELLRYDEDSAGGLMAKEIIKANLNWTVVQTIDEIRRQAENVEKIFSIYVVDNKEQLLGRVALKKLILASSNTKVADLYEENIISVPTYMEGEEVAEIMRKYDLEAVPVVNVKNKLVGRITVDDILDLIRDQAEEDIQAMTGFSDDVEESDSVYRLSRARLPWLLIGMVGGLLGAGFIGFFEEGLNAVTALAFFIPLITATGGNVGIQSSTLIVQSLANRSVFEDSLTKRLLKVFLVAVLNGLVLALFVMGTVVFLYDKEVKFGLVVSIALFSVVLLASFMGTLTPIILDKLGINPAMASGPFITTANDLMGLAVYFMVATLLLNL